MRTQRAIEWVPSTHLTHVRAVRRGMDTAVHTATRVVMLGCVHGACAVRWRRAVHVALRAGSVRRADESQSCTQQGADMQFCNPNCNPERICSHALRCVSAEMRAQSMR